MQTALRLAVLLAPLLLAACQTAVVPAQAPAVYDGWTTPPDWNAQPAPRLERQPQPTWAVEPRAATPLTLEAEVALFSRYVWRGQRLTDDPVFQPDVTVGWGDVSLNVWASMDLTDVNGNELEFSEVDFTLEVGREITTEPCSVRLFGGAILYTFPNTAFDSTLELFAGIALGVPLAPSLTVYQDVQEIDGTYVELGLHHDVALPLGRLSLGAALGWGGESYNDGYWGVRAAGLNDLRVTAGWPVELEGWTIEPSIAFSALLDDDVRRSAAKSDLWIFGVTVARSL